MLDNIKTIHFIGIKGVGMAALAIFAKEKGYKVTGSDVSDSFVTDELLTRAGIPVFKFDAKNLKTKPDLVVVSAAYDKNHPEVKEARKKRLEVKLYSEVLGLFSSDSQVIAVAGIHGKTTTTALISFLLVKANLDPSFVIGSGKINCLGNTGHFGKGDYFVLEADEYRKGPDEPISKFFDLSPQIEIITSIDMDHPDMFASLEKVYEVFYKFACRLPRSGFIVMCTDYPKSKKLLRSLVDRNFETYGFEEGTSWQIADFFQTTDLTSFNLLHQDKKYGPFKLKIPGQANALNAAAAIITVMKLGIEERLIKKYLYRFSGVKRRFEQIGESKNILIIDDYAHHPRSIVLTLEAVRQKYPQKKIVCIFQPHTYSRTKELLNDFAIAFKSADKVIITDIYASAREKMAVISGADLAAAARKNKKQVKFISSWDSIVQEIIDNVEEPTVVVTMGAGDIYQLGEKILKQVQNES